MQRVLADIQSTLSKKKRDQEAQEREKFNTIDREEKQKEAARLKKEEEAKRILEQKLQERELEMQRKIKKEEDRLIQQNAEKQRIHEEELRKKEIENKKRAEERSRRIEEERKKRLDEMMKRQEEKKVEIVPVEENNSKEPIESMNFVSRDRLEAQPIPDFIDLLGGAADEDWEPRKNNSRSQQKSRQLTHSYDDASNDDASDRSSRGSNSFAQHRLTPQRGRIDEMTDDILDSINWLEVPLKKQGKSDGVYLYGQRVMKIAINRNNGTPQVVLNPTQQMGIEDFLQKFMKCEKVRMKGLQSAIFMSRMMNNSSQSIDMPVM